LLFAAEVHCLCDAERIEITDGGISGSKKCKTEHGRANGGVSRGLRLAAAWSLETVLCWCVWQESGFSHRKDVPSFNLVHKVTLQILYVQRDLQI
jgi:hypothetical protein